MNHYRELKGTINLALVAMNELDKAIEKITEGDFSYNMTLSWHHINGILIYTNRVSRILLNKQQESRGTEIRDKLKVDDASPSSDCEGTLFYGGLASEGHPKTVPRRHAMKAD
jgi:hypothetical protein